MINQLHRWLHKVEDGYDPVPPRHVQSFSETAWAADNTALVDEIDGYVGGLAGKRVLDLGGGPGHLSAAFARRGASVTWHDISLGYLTVLEEKTADMGLDIRVSLGYLEDARKFVEEPFDLVFIKQTWAYCINDRAFAKLVYDLVKPGGACYITCSTPAYDDTLRGLRKVVYWLNGMFYVKVGHPYPPHGRIASIIHRFPVEHMILDYSSELSDKILFRKRDGGGA